MVTHGLLAWIINQGRTDCCRIINTFGDEVTTVIRHLLAMSNTPHIMKQHPTQVACKPGL